MLGPSWVLILTTYAHPFQENSVYEVYEIVVRIALGMRKDKRHVSPGSISDAPQGGAR